MVEYLLDVIGRLSKEIKVMVGTFQKKLQSV